MNFAIPPKAVEYSEVLLPFEMLFREINSLDIGNFNKECVKSRLKESAYSSFKQVFKTSNKHLSIGEAKFCDQLLKLLTNIEYTIKDSFSFAKEVLEFVASLFTTNFDIKSLFTNIPLTETLNLCI